MCERLLTKDNEKEEEEKSHLSLYLPPLLSQIHEGIGICMLYCSETSGFRQESTYNSADKPDKPQLGHVEIKDMEHSSLVAS